MADELATEVQLTEKKTTKQTLQFINFVVNESTDEPDTALVLG